MNSTALYGQVLNATAAEVRELIWITEALDDREPDHVHLLSWLLHWARGGWDSINEYPGSAGYAPATPQRVISYYRAYLNGRR